MMKFNKNLLTAAVVGALALPGLASAASLGYASSKQITYAKDLIVNNGTTIYTPTGLTLAGTVDDTARLATVAANTNVTFKVTLTDGAKFDTTADASTLVGNFVVGNQLGGGAINVIGTPYYSTSGQELNFTIRTAAAGSYIAGGNAITLNSMQVTNLRDGLFTGDQIGAEITAQNSLGQQILASKATIAKSVWGLTVASSLTGTDSAPGATKKIDVGSTPNPKTWFSPTGAVGGSVGSPVGYDFFSLGALKIDVARPLETDGVTTSAVNNYNANAGSAAAYNVVSTAVFKLTLTADGFGNYGSRIKLSTAANCASPVGTSTSTSNPDAVEVALPASSPLLAGITAAPPTASTIYVCAIANGTNELVPVENISVATKVEYNLSTQRVDPTLPNVNFGKIGYNGSDLVFQNVNPAGNPTAQSFLRLTNNNGSSCRVELEGKDDNGRYNKNTTVLTINKHASVTVNSDDLENGNSTKGITGGFGDGAGKWYVRVNAQCTNFKASALNRNAQTGTVTDLTAEKTIGSEWSVDKAVRVP